MNYTAALMFILPQAKWRFSGDVIPEGGWTYNDIIWEDLFHPKPTEAELETAWKYSQASMENDYRLQRLEHYPSADQQLAIIFDRGIDGWKEYIQNVKNNIPKPTVD
jgi:hypothetical protein